MSVEYEIFLEIDGFPDYHISDLGRVWSNRYSRYLKGGLDRNGYLAVNIFNNNKGKWKKIHRLVALNFLKNPQNKPHVDHINGNTGDNRLENLRFATKIENLQNRKIGSNNTSGVKGVYYDKKRNTWKAQINIDGIRVYLGRFNTIEEAKQVRVKKANEVFGVYTHSCEKM
jgi:hypothetical protein